MGSIGKLMRQRTALAWTTLAWCTTLVLTVCVAVPHAEGTSDYIHYRLGVKYKNERKYDQSAEEFRRVLAAYPDNYNAYMHLAEIRMDQGKYRLAMYNLKKALSYNPGWGKAHKLLARAYDADRQYEKAIMELQLYQQTCDPSERDSVQTLINTLVKRTRGEIIPGDTVGTVSHDGTSPGEGVAEKSLAAAPSKKVSVRIKPVRSKDEQVEAVFQSAVDAYNAGNYKKALTIIRKVITLQPGHPGAYYYAGLIRRRAGQNDMARVNFEKALAFPDLGYNAHFYLGKMYGEKKQYAQAVEHLEAYIQLTSYEPGEREARALVTRYRAAMGAEAAKEEARKNKKMDLPLDLAMERGVETPVYKPLEITIDSLLSMAVVDTLSDAGQRMLTAIRAFKADNFDKSIREFKKVNLDYPKGLVASQCLYNTGICYYKMHLFSDAENQFDQVIARFAGNDLAVKSSFLRALTYLERKDSQQAEKLIRRFIQNNRSHAWVGVAYEKLGDAYADLEQPGKAADAYLQSALKARNPREEVEARFKLAKMYHQLDNPKKAMAEYEAVVATGEKAGVYVRVPDAYYKMADYLYEKKMYQKALDMYKKVSRKYPAYQETPWGLFQIGNCFKNLKKFQAAIAAYKSLMDGYADDYWARQAKWKMEDTVWENEYKAVLR